MKQKLLNSFKLRAVMLVAILCAGFTSAWGQAAVNTILWEETWFDGTANTTPSSYQFSGTTVYGDATLTYAQSSTNTKLYDEALAGGTKPELLLSKSNQTWTISNIPTGQASEMSISFLSNKTTFEVTSSTTGITISGSGKSWTISATSNVSTFNLTIKNTGSSNARIDDIKLIVTKAGSSSNAVATTTTIDDSGITNTDVYTSTVAGSLAATVTAGGNAVAGATVTWSGNNDNVATINSSTGAVTLVAAGSVIFTATYAGVTDTYQPSSATYEMTVTSSAPYVQPTTIEITPNYTFWGKTSQFSGDTFSDLSGSKDNVTLKWTRGNGSTYANTTAMRFYKDNTLTFTAPTGYEIKSIVLTVSGTYSDLSFNPTGYDSQTTTWTGAATEVTMSRPSTGSSYSTISKFTITIGLPSSVTTPTFTVASGNYTETQNVKVDNYDEDYVYFYTTDGTDPDCDEYLDPTGTSVSYDHAAGISISTTTTLKIIAVDEDGNKSAIATAEYTFPTIYTTIAAFKDANTTGYLNLTGAQVVYIDSAKKNIYVRDASGAIDLFNSTGFTTSLTTGDILSGIIYGSYSPYKNLPEIKDIIDISVLTATSNQTVVAKVIDGTTTAIAANLCDLVKIESTEITEKSSKYYVGDNSDIQLYDNFSVGYEVTTGQPVDVSGIATVYNDTYELFPRVNEDIVYLATSEPVSITSSLGYSTFASENALDFTATDAIKVFYATVSGSTLTFTQINKVPANTGVLLYSTEGGAVAATNVPFLTGAADDVTGNVFVQGTGAPVSYETNGYNYILFNGEDGLGFYQANNNTVATNRAYIHIDGGDGVKSFAINFDALVDGITNIAKSQEPIVNGQIFNLAGQRMSKMQKGINIVNGKKVLVK